MAKNVSVRPRVERFLREAGDRLAVEDVTTSTRLKAQSVRYALETLVKEGKALKLRDGIRVYYTWNRGISPSQDAPTHIELMDSVFDIEYVGTLENGSVVVRDAENALFRLERI